MPHPTLDPDELEFIGDMLDEWNATDAARKVARYNVITFARWLAPTRLADATPDDCKRFLRDRARTVAAATVVRNWGDLRAFYRCAEDDITNPLDGRRSPMARIKMPRAPKYALTHAATVDEVDKLLATFDRRTELGLRNAAMVSLMFRSGLRVAECSRACLADVDVEGRRITLGLTKNLQPRQPLLHPETLALLKRYLRRRGDRPGSLFGASTSAIQTVVKRAAAAASVPVTPHCLRRGFVVEYMSHGGDVATLMIIGGWSSEVMIVRYMGDLRVRTAQTVYDDVARRQLASRRRLRAV